jgi:hypothetical protein
MKAVLVAFLVALSVSVWSYTKLQRQTGQGNAKSTLQGVALIFVLAFIIVFTLGRSLLH